jgi:hypothetical protein
MKKTLRLIVLAGIITTCWIASEKPIYAIQYCSVLNGTSCSPPSYYPKPCLIGDDEIGENGTCYCLSGHWSCSWATSGVRRVEPGAALSRAGEKRGHPLSEPAPGASTTCGRASTMLPGGTAR